MTHDVVSKPFTHERCNCGWQRKIVTTSTFICPDCGKHTYRIREIIPAFPKHEHNKGKKGNKVSEGKGQQAFTLPKKLVGASDPSAKFLGIKSTKGENK